MERSECCFRRLRGNKMRRGGNKGRRALRDGGDGLVDLERLGDRNTALGADAVAPQAAKRGGVTKLE